MLLKDGLYIDGNSLGAIVNDCIDLNKLKDDIDTLPYKKINSQEYKIPLEEGKKYNCIYKAIHDKRYVIALEDIEIGQELYVSYGKSYWIAYCFNLLAPELFNFSNIFNN